MYRSCGLTPVKVIRIGMTALELIFPAEMIRTNCLAAVGNTPITVGRGYRPDHLNHKISHKEPFY
jgi:hypothetical protein